MFRMADVDPDLVIADVFLPGRSGFDICRAIKKDYRHVRVILTAGLLEPFDEEEARRAGCDAILKKPFEASVVMLTIRPLVHDAQLARGLFAEALISARPVEPPADAAPRVPAAPPPDPERVEAAITLALDAALPALVREITERVLVALGH
jgi:CheY-like chemotaxis protein